MRRLAFRGDTGPSACYVVLIVAEAQLSGKPVHRRNDVESSAQDGAVPAYELIIVSYNSRSQIEGLLAGLPTDMPLAIVDNARGADGLREMIRHRPTPVIWRVRARVSPPRRTRGPAVARMNM